VFNASKSQFLVRVTRDFSASFIIILARITASSVVVVIFFRMYSLWYFGHTASSTFNNLDNMTKTGGARVFCWFGYGEKQRVRHVEQTLGRYQGHLRLREDNWVRGATGRGLRSGPFSMPVAVASVHAAAKNAKGLFFFNAFLLPRNVSTPFYYTTVLFAMIRTSSHSSWF
jgi:hypothetical protein